MFSKQSVSSWQTPEERRNERLALWNGAIQIVKAVSDVHLVGRQDCGWRGDHRDVAAVADHLSTMNPGHVKEQVAAAAEWINSARDRDPNGLRMRADHAIVHDLLSHLKRTFPNG